jgi:tRNA 5-methylaminomethyl-2-thiouridine biosynthesis bifunctional protein
LTPQTDPRANDLEWLDGQPRSRRFGDVYFARESGRDETAHVFLAGNGLPERWAALAPHGRFTIGETGFGTALGFVCAWALWNEVAPPDARLDFVSVERYPLGRTELTQALALWPALAPQRTALLSAWEDFAPGWHRLEFDSGRIALTLLVGDAARVLPRLDAKIDAWFLDGFSPARNPDMWATSVLAEVARLARPGATFATYTVAGEVRRGLEDAGFEVRKTPGFGRKREMLCGVRRTGTASAWRAPWFVRPAPSTERRAIVIGAGLAGAATAGALAARDWDVTVVDRRATVAAEASGNHQAVLYAHPSPHPTALNELALTGLQHARRLLDRVLASSADAYSRCGVLQLAFDPAEALRQARVAALGLPASLLEPLDRARASERAGVEVPEGGLFFPRAGWARPRALCDALLSGRNLRLALGTSASGVVRTGANWTVLAGERVVATAPVVVLAASGEVASFAPARHLPLRAIRGQITLVPATEASRALQTVLCGAGYIAPARSGLHSLGATHRFRDTGIDVRADEHVENLTRLRALSPALHAALGAERLAPAALAGRAGLRCSSPDYLPIIGPVVDAAEFASTYVQLSRDATLELDTPAPWLDGLYVSTAHGSRGLISAPIAGELLAAYLDGGPVPLPASVVDSLHPNRFLLRALIRRGAGSRHAPAREQHEAGDE